MRPSCNIKPDGTPSSRAWPSYQLFNVSFIEFENERGRVRRFFASVSIDRDNGSGSGLVFDQTPHIDFSYFSLRISGGYSLISWWIVFGRGERNTIPSVVLHKAVGGVCPFAFVWTEVFLPPIWVPPAITVILLRWKPCAEDRDQYYGRISCSYCTVGTCPGCERMFFLKSKGVLRWCDLSRYLFGNSQVCQRWVVPTHYSRAYLI